MAEYDPNLPQEFAHMPKRHGLGTIILIVAIIALFVLGGLLATLKHQPPSEASAAASHEHARSGAPAPVETRPETSAPTPAE